MDSDTEVQPRASPPLGNSRMPDVDSSVSEKVDKPQAALPRPSAEALKNRVPPKPTSSSDLLAPFPPSVRSILYWQNPIKSGAAFAGSLYVIYSLGYGSSTAAASLAYYACLFILLNLVYVNVLQKLASLQNKPVANPWKDAIERNKLLIPKASVQAQVGPVVDSINVVLSKLFRVLLVEDNMQSLKALGYLFVVSILGSLFTLPALCLYGVVLLFIVPKLYQSHQVEIDKQVGQIYGQVEKQYHKGLAAVKEGIQNSPLKNTPIFKKFS